ncbi:MAG: hypothetical protein AAGA65_07595 [Actinomycetota bacterium]
MGRRLYAGLVLRTIVGWVTASLLLATAALGLWLDFGYGPDATNAWDNIEELQREIDRGLVVDNLHHLFAIAAFGTTVVWLAMMAAARSRLALVVAVVLGLSVTAWWTARASPWMQRSVFDSGAATVGVVAAALLLSQLRAQGGILAAPRGS